MHTEAVLPAVLLCVVVLVTVAVTVNVGHVVKMGSSGARALYVMIATPLAPIVPMATSEGVGAQVLPRNVQVRVDPGGTTPVNTTLSASEPPVFSTVIKRQ